MELLAESFDPAAALAGFTARAQGAGAVASFTGIARPHTAGGEAIQRLFLDHHPRLTLASLEEIAAAAASRFDLIGAQVLHRCGLIRPGEPIVFVAAAAAHRRPAFDAVDYVMDRLKTEAVLWKREDGVDGPRWIEPTQADRAAHARWSDTCPGSTQA